MLDDARQRYRESRRFSAVDALRAFAATVVVWRHASQALSGYFSHSFGVKTFFIISGFVVSRMLLREREQTGTISIGRFWMRRWLRTLPLYYAVLAAYVLLVAWLERGTPSGDGFWANLPYYLTLTTNWFVNVTAGERVIFYFAWSLAVQEQFYLFWPIILRHVPKRFAIAIPLAFLLAADLAGLTGATAHLQKGLALRVVASLDSPIFFGVLAAIVLESERGFRLVQRVAGQPWSIPAAVALVLLPAWFPGEPEELINLSLTYLVAVCVLAPTWMARIVATPVVLHVGIVSYGIYLMHMMVLNAVRRLLPAAVPAVVFALGLPLSVLVATASYRWFEQPFLRLQDARFPWAAPGLPVFLGRPRVRQLAVPPPPRETVAPREY